MTDAKLSAELIRLAHLVEMRHPGKAEAVPVPLAPGVGESALKFRPFRSGAASVVVIYSEEDYYVEAGSYSGSSSEDPEESDGEAFALSVIDPVANFGLVRVREQGWLGIWYRTGTIIPNSKSEMEELRRNPRVRIEQSWLPW